MVLIAGILVACVDLVYLGEHFVQINWNFLGNSASLQVS